MQIDFSCFSLENLKPQNEFECKVVGFLQEWFSDCKTLWVQTSGSTGIPKTIEVEKQKMLNSAKMTCDFLGLKEGNSALLCLPVEYISGKMMLVRAIERKLNIFIQTPSTQPLETLTQSINFCAMTPLQVQNSLDKIHFIKNLIIGGAEVSENLKSKIRNTLSKGKNNIYETYGMSETLSHIALKQIFPKAEDEFRCLEGIRISTDNRNCLQIFAPQLNAETIQTNDIVELKGKQSFKFLGRIDYVINSGGAKIFPEELESLVKKYLTNEVVFLGKKDEVLGEKLILVVESTEKTEVEKVISKIEFRHKFHFPKEIIVVEKFPRTPNGKVSRLALKKMLFC